LDALLYGRESQFVQELQAVFHMEMIRVAVRFGTMPGMMEAVAAGRMMLVVIDPLDCNSHREFCLASFCGDRCVIQCSFR
jgi:hypothetical protein